MSGEEQVAGAPMAETSALRRSAMALVRLGGLISDVAGWLAIGCLAALLLLVLVQTAMGLLSPFFPAATSAMSVSWEYSGYLMGTAFMFGLAQTLRLGGHIRVNVIFDALKPGARRIVDFVCSAASFGMMVILGSALTNMAVRAFATNSLSTASYTPLWIPQGAFAVAAWLFTLQLFIRMVALASNLPAEEAREYVGASE